MVDNVKPTFHIYGHVHQVIDIVDHKKQDFLGTQQFYVFFYNLYIFRDRFPNFQDAGVRTAQETTFVNAATCDYMGSPIRKPIVLLLPKNRNN